MPPQLAYRRLNPAKLLLSKWTAARPSNREKHFLVTKLFEPDEAGSGIEWVEIEAIHSRRCERIAWRELCDGSRWLQGWK
ncbi:TIGR02450 family Trp-rich protein [Niveibacterium sp. 24ML]|uniref:TIGR02450 family Trp-rich protein n=1 Tax=Niveibacterium sp. 24ML TaxID=2985512 RepID=UPI002270B073|nr:TIGR02450 family Trp-rich protein [Niveibacterium sp. 24ML]MCX9156370.1 TIGR02450 family Trp-rich protein [Niveibacterium sp. 24ML]